MRAIDRENLELLASQMPHPAGNVRSFPIRLHRAWISIGCQARLALWKLSEGAQWQPRIVACLPSADHGRKNVTHHRQRQNYTDCSIKEEANLKQHSASRESIRRSHRIPPRNCKAFENGCGRCATSQATMSETSSGDMGLPGTSPRQSGAPNSGRPAITVVRRYWSLTSARYEPSTMELARAPPLPSAP